MMDATGPLQGRIASGRSKDFLWDASGLSNLTNQRNLLIISGSRELLGCSIAQDTSAGEPPP